MNRQIDWIKACACAVLTISGVGLSAAPIVVDNGTPGAIQSAGWANATAASNHYGPMSIYASTGGSLDTVMFTPDLPTAGTYLVEAWNSCYSPRASAVPHDVSHTGGIDTVYIDQDSGTGICGEWQELGTYDFDAGTAGFVQISDDGVVGAPYIGADAVRFTNVNVFSIDYAYSDGATLTLEGENIDVAAATSAALSWPNTADCPHDPGNSCSSTPLTIATITGSQIVTSIPSTIREGNYEITVDNGDDSQTVAFTVGALGLGLNPVSTGSYVSFDGSNWVARSPAQIVDASNADKRQPSLGLNYIIALFGQYPSRNGIAQPTLGEITLFAGNFAPRSWAYCNGQLLPISQNSALFSILGTTYGGDGRTSFALPDLRGRVAVHSGGRSQGPGLSVYSLGQKSGTETH